MPTGEKPVEWQTPVQASKMKLPPAPETPPSRIQGLVTAGAEHKLPASVNDTVSPKPSPEKFSPLDRSVSAMSEAEKLSAAKLNTTSSAMLDDLSKVPSTDVQKAVAGNIRTPELTLGRLAQHHLSSIRAVVAENPKTSSKILRSLAHDSADSVRMAVARNSKSDTFTLILLKEDANPTVRQLAHDTFLRR
jgi:hypothetical protein